jgi:hypothetical protein
MSRDAGWPAVSTVTTLIVCSAVYARLGERQPLRAEDLAVSLAGARRLVGQPRGPRRQGADGQGIEFAAVVIRNVPWRLGPGDEKPGEGPAGYRQPGGPLAVAVTVRSRVGRGVGAAVDRFVDRHACGIRCDECHG